MSASVSRRSALRTVLVAAFLGMASLGSVSQASAQVDARLDVILPARAVGQGDGPAFVPRAMLATRELRDLLRAGFPARLHFRSELWRNEPLNNTLDAAVEWDMLVRFDQLNRKFEVYRIVGDRANRLGRYDSAEEAEQQLERPYRIIAPPMRRGRSYYYDSSVDVEVLSLSDLDEVERWLRGEVRPTLRGDRNPGTAVTRTVRSFFVRLLGGERRHYQTQTKTFRAE
ncbi:MAG TPA: hypothetical protein VE861_02410 [Gemmatimonadaceae bacterium]|nr:hypothetical protein [Gemmatimonadaceae bacterium]